MNILLCQYRPAIRLYKWARLLTKLGYRVTVLHTSPPVNNLRWNQWPVVKYDTITAYETADVFISFNPAVICSIPAFRPEIYTIQAVGDLRGLYSPKHRNIEDVILHRSNACCFVSPAQAKAAAVMYGIPEGAPVVYNVVSDDMYVGRFSGARHGLVYAGTLSGDMGHHRNITWQLKRIAREYCQPVHIYPSALGVPFGYLSEPQFVIHESVSPYELIYELSKYQFGICENGDPEIRGMMLPNKFYEYLTAGLDLIYPGDAYEIKQQHAKFISLPEAYRMDWLTFEMRNEHTIKALLP